MFYDAPYYRCVKAKPAKRGRELPVPQATKDRLSPWTSGALPAALLVVLFAALLSGCGPAKPSFPDLKAYPVSVASWGTDGVYLVGTLQGGDIYLLQSGKRVLLDGGSNARRMNAVRLKIDEARSRLWVLDLDSVSVYALSQTGGVLLAKAPLTGIKQRSKLALHPCFPDMEITDSGAVLITSNQTPSIVEARLDNSARPEISIQQFELGRDGPGARLPFGLSAISMVDGTERLLAADARDGSLWLIAQSSWGATRVTVTNGLLEGACGIAPAAFRAEKHVGRLLYYVARGFRGGIVLVELTEDLSAAKVIAEVFPAGEPVFGMTANARQLAFPVGHLVREAYRKGGDAIQLRAISLGDSRP